MSDPDSADIDESCPECGAPLESDGRDYYECGVRDCRHTEPAPRGVLRDRVRECPSCGNDTLILHKERSSRCPNPDCDYSSSSTQRGGCYVATAAIPDRPDDVARLRAFRDRRLRGPLGRPLLGAYYAAQPYLDATTTAPRTRTLVRASAAALRRAEASSWIGPLWSVAAASLFVAAFASQVAARTVGPHAA